MSSKHTPNKIHILIGLFVVLQIIIVCLLSAEIIIQNKSNPSKGLSYLTVKIVDDKDENYASDMDSVLINSGHIDIALSKSMYQKSTGNTISASLTEDEILGLYLDYFGIFGWQLIFKDQNTLFFSKQVL